MKNHDLLTLSHLAYTYPNAEKPTFSDLSLAVKKGDFILLLGANGSGKSTFFKLLMQQYQPSKGRILTPPKCTIQYISQKMEESLFMDMTLEENLRLLVEDTFDREGMEAYLASYNPKLPQHMKRQVYSLSGGEKQALILAIKLYRGADLLLLDEHTSALDPATERQVMAITNKIIARHQITTIMSTHNLNMIRSYGDRILGLKNGKIMLDQREKIRDISTIYDMIYL